MARQGEPFDEIMIINPYSQQGGERMRFYTIPTAPFGYVMEAPEQMGYFAEVPETVGYVYEAPETMGYYGAMPETMGYVYEAPDIMGYVADPPPGFVEGYNVGYYAEAPELGYVYEVPEQMGYYAGNRSPYENRNHAAACDCISQAGRRDGAASPCRAASWAAVR